MSPTKYEVPSKDYSLQYRELLSELMPELERAFLEDDPILGKAVATFEREFATACGVAHAVGLNSGTDALTLALRALGVNEGDEVITQANTFIATITAIHSVGAKAVLVDPDATTMLITPSAVEAAVTRRTRAILPVHLYGSLTPMDEIVALTRNRDIRLIEDAAQAHGATDRSGRRAGSFGDAGCFSFHPSKNLGAFGDAGAVTTDSAELARRLGVLRNLGKATKYEVRELAPNSKLDTIQAVILRIKLRRLDAWNDRRRALARQYRALLDGVGDLELPIHPDGGEHVFHLYVVRTGARDALRDHLKNDGINAGLHYPIPPHLQPLNVDLGYRRGALPIAEQGAERVLSLPLSPELTELQIEQVCESIRRYFQRATRT